MTYPEDLKGSGFVPYDLSNMADRRALIGKTIMSNLDRDEYPLDDMDVYFPIQTITAIGVGYVDDKGTEEWCVPLFGDMVDGEELLSDYVFLDTGKPVGKEVRA